MSIISPSLLTAWNDLICAAANGQNEFSLRRTEAIGHEDVRILTMTERIPLSLGGFQSRRWLRYVDDYLNGGPSFVKFLQDYCRKPRLMQYHFGGSQSHTHGSCIQSISLNPEPIQLLKGENQIGQAPYIYLHSRACDICPTGLLDLTLLWWVGHVTGLQQAWWEIDRAKFTVWQSVARRDIVAVTKRTRLGPAIRQYLEDHHHVEPSSIRFMRARSILRRRKFMGSLDELEVILNPVRINPNDLQLIYGVPRTKIQGFLKEEYGWSAQGSGNRSYSWTSYRDPIFLDVMERFHLDPQRLPPIERVAQQRSHRSRTENGGDSR